MSEQSILLPPARRLSSDKPLSIAILAMGGQGGGVLSDWIVALGESQGWVTQATSVPGVAQRTGATIYYIEMLPARNGCPPVFSLMPTQADVDIILAAELMEAGRSILRGLVTPDRTTLIASTHRAYAVVEKQQPGDGSGDPALVIDASDYAARRTIAFDMERVAVQTGSMISAALFGALAASAALPFAKPAFEATVQSGGKAAAASLLAFNAAYDRAVSPARDAVTKTPAKRFLDPPDSAGHPLLDRMLQRIRAEFPEPTQAMLFSGVFKLTDFQDPAYADDYLDRIATLLDLDRRHNGAVHGYVFTVQAAKYLANAMSYDDVIRVADLKARGARFERVRHETGVAADQIIYTTEYMHPRMDEVCGTLPRTLGLWIESHPRLFRSLDRIVNRGRRVRSRTLLWFLALYVVSGLRRYRLASLRHLREMQSVDAWISVAAATLPQNYTLAAQVLAARRLIKGYSDTHARGTSKFDRVLAALPLLTCRDDGAAWLRRLIQAALQDEDGTALDGALRNVASL